MYPPRGSVGVPYVELVNISDRITSFSNEQLGLG